MSLNWNWNDKHGHIEWNDPKWKNTTIYQGNALSIWIDEFEDNTYQMSCFFIDKEHLKRCCAEFNPFEHIRKVVFYTWNKNNKDLAEMLAKHSILFTVDTAWPF